MTPEQKSLLDKAERSIEAAQSLTDQGFHDFAISRGYYAMFYIAEALLDNEGLSFSSHAAVCHQCFWSLSRSCWQGSNGVSSLSN